ncbi:MAG: AraC family transcriptional regulator [Neomegalonema sp.]|nr:AraC family transcriptional regulator [Neomegalonema sp.]
MSQPLPSSRAPITAIAQAAGDPLGEILHLLKPTGVFYCQSRLRAPWGVAVPAFPGMLSFIAITHGACWVTMAERAPIQAREGQLVLMTTAAPAHYQSELDAPLTDLAALPVRKVTALYETLEFGGDGPETTFTYGLVRIDHAASEMLLALLPDLLQIDSKDDGADDWLRSTFAFIGREAQELRPGGETVITRLVDIIVIEAIRRWLSRAPEAEQGWLRAARDPQIGRAILAIHRDPAASWTVASLAKLAGMSRSSFSARFSNLLGAPAMQYVTTWRMNLAREQLRNSPHPVAAIAEGLGYQSEPAFSRAFKRINGVSPGQYRVTARQGRR